MGKEYIVGLDIGTTKICAAVGELSESGALRVIGTGVGPSSGMRKGVVVNIDDTVESIRTAVARAEKMADIQIKSVYVGIAGSHIMGINNSHVVAVRGGEVTQGDIDRVLEGAKVVSIPADREVIHILPQEYTVDNQRGINDPTGMAGMRLEAKVHIVTGAVSSAQNIVRACKNAGLHVADIVLESLASAKAVLTDDEREIGVALVDIGGGTTDIAVFANGAIKHTAVIALGGNNLTNDIAFVLKTPMAAAEKLKISHGCALAGLVSPDEFAAVPGVGARRTSRLPVTYLAEICEARMAEILSIVDRKLDEAGCRELIGSGVVLTGGTALIRGCEALGEDLFGLSTRIGSPRNVGGFSDAVSNPKFSTAVGLLRYGAEKESAGAKKFDDGEEGMFTGILRRMKRWMADIS